MATGLHRAGEWQQAIEYYLKLVDLEEREAGPGKLTARILSAATAGSRPGWACFAAKAGAAAAAEIDRALETALGRGQEGHELRRPEALPRLLRQSTPGGRGADRTAQAPDASGADPGGRVAHGRGRRFHRTARPRPALLADMAELNFMQCAADACRAAMPPLVSASFSRSSPTCLATPGMTPEPVACRLSRWRCAPPGSQSCRPPAWPVGEVEASQPDTNENPWSTAVIVSTCSSAAGPWTGGGPFFADFTVSLENNQQEVSLRDGLGHLQRPISLVENGRDVRRSCTTRIRPWPEAAAICWWFPWGRRSVPWIRGRPRGQRPRPILWSQDLSDDRDR